jgi:hypothetical protein
MIVRDDVAKIFDLRDEYMAALVVKHEYATSFKRKYVGTPLENDNLDYPCKNWSSVILWNCAHYANRGLNPTTVAKADTKYLHRFGWIEKDRLGELPAQYNWLDMEYSYCDNAKLIHHTLGLPGFAQYADSDYADEWHRTLLDTLNLSGEDPLKVVARAKDRL